MSLAWVVDHAIVCGLFLALYGGGVVVCAGVAGLVALGRWMVGKIA